MAGPSETRSAAKLTAHAARDWVRRLEADGVLDPAGADDAVTRLASGVAPTEVMQHVAQAVKLRRR